MDTKGTITKTLKARQRVLGRALLVPFFILTALVPVACGDDPLRLEIECDDEEVGIIIGLELEEHTQDSEFGLLRGARISIGLDETDGHTLDDCCTPRTWRQWTRPSEPYLKRSPLGLIEMGADQWNEDFDPRTGSSNLPSQGPDPANGNELPFDSIFRDPPGATADEIEVEFITCYGCVDNDGLNFSPLACFEWSYEVDDGDIDVDGFDELDVEDVNDMNLPQASHPQPVPPEPF